MSLNAVQLLAVEFTIAALGLYLAYKCFGLKKENMNFFMRFMIILNLYLLENIPVRIVELHLVMWNRELVFLLYAFSIVLMTLLAAHWCLFVLKQVNSKLVCTEKRIRIFFMPAFISIPLCTINYWTGWLYMTDENGWYTRGSIFVLQAILSYGYVAILVGGCLSHLIFDKDKTMAIKCSFCTIPSVVGTLLQIVFGGSYLLIGVVITAWTMYIEICLDRQKAYELSEAIYSINSELVHSNKQIAENMKTILALSDIYYALYEIDFVSDTLKEIKAPDYISEFSNQFTSARECVGLAANEMFSDGYVALLKELFAPDSIMENLRTKNSFFVDAVSRYKKDWIRSTATVVERGEDGNVTRVVLSFEEIGDIIEQQKKVEEAKIYEIHAEEMKELFIQTAEALVSAIDAKDQYTRGHSVRVATYAKQIAELSGLPEAECEEVYFAGLLHDVGKIGIPDGIINKAGRLTDEEFNEIKQHPVYGSTILNRINRLPYLSIGAKYHHERYDGKGYPTGLCGEDIPQMARIIAVADAYDAMTSKRSYRNTIPQQTVREEIIKGMGTQFDPKFAKLMVYLIDKDFEYNMQEHSEFDEDDKVTELVFAENRSACSKGMRITETKYRIHFTYSKTAADGMPSIVLYDSGDAVVHKGDNYEKQLSYYEYGEIKLDGSYILDGIRANNIDVSDSEDISRDECNFEIVKDNDHIYFEMQSEGKHIKGTLALPDNTRYVYMSITGTNCIVRNINDSHDDEPIKDGAIKRIVDPISYLSGKEGNLPSIQIDGYRTASTPGILLDSKVDIEFEMKCLPFAERIWHCPYVIIYYSDDGQLFGANYREYGVIRFNGESWGEVEGCANKITVDKTIDFPGWDQWKQDNKAGRKCNVSITLVDNCVVLKTASGGIDIENVTEIEADKKIYVALSGDQCVIENINVIAV